MPDPEGRLVTPVGINADGLPRAWTALWGYSGVAGEDVQDTNLDAGNNSVDTTPVPAGEIQVVRQVSIRYDGTTPTYIDILAQGTPGTPQVFYEGSVVSGTWYPASTFVVLETGNFMRSWVIGATAGDDVYFRYSGYRMEL